MTQAAVTANLDQALDIHLRLATQVAFHREVLGDVLAQRGRIRFAQVFYPGIGTNLGGGQDFTRACRSDPIDIGQTSFHPLIAGQINAFNTSHSLHLSLSLLVLGVFADHK
jgi:hypothetical protein